MLAKIFKAVVTFREHRRQPLHVEFNLTDYCNLNCKGCSHYSPLAPAEFETLAQLEDAMRSVSAIRGRDKIKEVFLIGGETLLYPQITEAVSLARKYFPTQRILVFTNGLPLPKMDEEFWTACRESRAVIAITRYPIKFDYEKVEELCRERGVEFKVFGDRGVEGTFFKLPLDPEKKQNGRVSHFKCSSHGCITIDGDKIFPCAQAACVGHLNRRFGTDFRWEAGDYIRVADIKDVRQLEKLRSRPVPFCGYCKPETVTQYGNSRRLLSEWT